MELARALTTRRHKPTPPALNTAYLGRAASQRASNAKPVRRQDISLPVELLSSTNVLTYEAPNIPDAPNARDRSGRYFKPSTLSTALSVSSSNNASDNDSDNSHSDHSPDTDATSIDLSSPESSHDPFSHFGKNAFPKPLVGTVKSVRSTASSEHEPTSPKIPARAPSHTRRAHVLSHTRSILSRERPARHSQSPSSPTSARHNSLDMFNSTAINMIAPPSPATPTTALPAAPVSYPFGKELEQLDEAQLDFASAVRDADMDADASAMRSRGLMRFCAADYLEEIAGLSPFAREPSYQSMAWI